MRVYNINKNIFPLLVHFNDTSKDFLTEGVVNDIIMKSKPIEKPDNLSIITFATSDEYPLIKQLKANNLEYFNFCVDGENWDNTNKVNYLQDQKNKITTEYVICLDAIDLLLSEDFKDTVNRFNKTNYDILYGAGKNNYPNINIDGEKINHQNHPNKFINCGCVIGKTKEFFEFINKCYIKSQEIRNVWNSEQYIIRNTLIENKDLDIGVDYNCQFFQNMGRTDFKLQNNIFIIKN